MLDMRSRSTERVTVLALFLFYLLLHAEGVAAPVTADDARSVVQGWLSTGTRPLGADVGEEIREVIPFEDAGVTLFFVVYLHPSGFAIVSSDDWIEPIITFTSRGTFDSSDANPLGALVNRDMRNRLAVARGAQDALQKGESPGSGKMLFEEALRKWQDLKAWPVKGANNPKYVVSVSDERVSPFVQSVWDQGDDGSGWCYNYYTPNNYPCGCSATAMAQLMRYHQYPAIGVGTTSFEITVDGETETRALRGGDGLGGAYDWASMILDPGTSMTEAQRQAIGAVCHDAGVASRTSYTPDASSADLVDSAGVLKSVFQYGNVVQGQCSGSTFGSGLNGILNPNLDAKLPVFLAIYGSVGGHAVICDGYGYNVSTMYHHLNLGWGASASTDNAWYALPLVDTIGATFTTVEYCMYNIFTAGSGEIISGRVTDSAGNPVGGATISAERTGGGSWTATSDALGVYALSPVQANSSYTITVSKSGYYFFTGSASTGRSMDFEDESGNVWGVDFAGEAISLTVESACDGRYSDYDGDGVSDFTVYHETSGTWFIMALNGALISWGGSWGGAGFVPVSGDYDGDGVSDIAVYHEANGMWFIISLNGTLIAYGSSWGGSEFVPVSGDFDGDGVCDLAVFLQSMGDWYIVSLDGRVIAYGTGVVSGYAPVAGDYDGDGASDLAMYNQAEGSWTITSAGAADIASGITWGGDDCIPLSGDFDGDGKADIAVFYEPAGTWYIRSVAGDILAWEVKWGTDGYTPLALDFDGDGLSDLVVYCEETGCWYARSLSGDILIWESQWGGNGFHPLSSL